MNAALREEFDAHLEAILGDLPDHLIHLLEEVPLIVEDEPSDILLRDLSMDRRTSELCGLHWGVALTHRSVEHSGVLPDRIMLFRGPIMRLARYEGRAGFSDRLHQQIRITLLHEIGHHFGLDEDDLAELGYA